MKPSFTTVLLAAAVFSSVAVAAEVDQREANQQGRIAQGVRSGQLTDCLLYTSDAADE